MVEPGRFKIKQGGVLWFLEMRVCIMVCSIFYNGRLSISVWHYYTSAHVFELEMFCLGWDATDMYFTHAKNNSDIAVARLKVLFTIWSIFRRDLEKQWGIFRAVTLDVLGSASPMHFCLNEQQLQLTGYLQMVYHKVLACCISVWMSSSFGSQGIAFYRSQSL